MGLSFDGLASGLDTTAIIKALMDVEAIPQTLLKNKVADKNTIIANLQSLNSSLQDLVADAKTASGATSLASFTGTSSSDAVSVSASATASAVSIDIVVDRVATAQTVVTAASAQWPDDPPTLTIVNAAGEKIEITAGSTSLDSVATAINAAGAGVTASTVPAGTDADGNALYRLQLVAADTGTEGAFTVYRGDAASVDAGTAIDVATQPGAATVTAAQDAQITLWAGTAAEQTITSSSNTFTGLMTGVDVTVSRPSTAPVSITVAPDTEASAATAKEFVDTIAAILAGIANGSKATVSTEAGENTTLGVFTGDSTVRALRQALSSAVQFPVDGTSPSTIGISIDRYGVLSFDKATFTDAIAKDPAAVNAIFSGIATRVQDVSDQYSDTYDGLLTMRITGQENEVESLGDQIERWDLRLEKRRASLERTYAQLEVMLSQMQAQSDYLTSQLSSLPSMKESS
ncbi:flagellar filament capping protein FliD [Paramicrobacterium agarici]|uniref:Flagellar hook-associated protein 2 n=1 Tax=Paramicrobacterium agarici TaxID=630514 RepID=A0A2A9DWV2_9MICO|nr:flagellar filament capping protein FliD [Microbacterium agarici]PFG30615.1 flagellar hook-associated protein 2 [Microbacterium agarici]TQO23633.1 flagellar hook-associated protein 2 [Microbacterium agarici]